MPKMSHFHTKFLKFSGVIPWTPLWEGRPPWTPTPAVHVGVSVPVRHHPSLTPTLSNTFRSLRLKTIIYTINTAVTSTGCIKHMLWKLLYIRYSTKEGEITLSTWTLTEPRKRHKAESRPFCIMIPTKSICDQTRNDINMLYGKATVPCWYSPSHWQLFITECSQVRTWWSLKYINA